MMDDNMAYIWMISNLLGGFALGLFIMLRANPYAWNNFKTRIMGRSFGCIEVELNNMEIGVQGIDMEDLELTFGKKTESPKFQNVRSKFRRKLGCPTIHFNYLSTEPVSLVHETRLIKILPTKVRVIFEDLVEKIEGKRVYQAKETRQIDADFKQLKVLPNIIRKKTEDGREFDVDETWTKVSDEEIIKPPEVFPEKFSSLVNKIRARAEIEASLQRLAQLIAMVNNTKWTLILSGICLVGILATAYMLYQNLGEVSATKAEVIGLKALLNQSHITVLEPMNLTG